MWLHTRSERLSDPSPADDRPAVPPRLPEEVERPKVLVAIPGTADGMPDDLTCDPDARTLCVGEGRVGPVAPEVVNYEVSGMNALRK